MRRRKRMAAALAAAVALGLLAGCQPDPAVSPVPSPAPAESQSPSPSPALLTQEELDELGQWLREGYGPVFSAPFSCVDEIDVSIVLHDGDGGENMPTADFTQEDREALAGIGVDLDARLEGALGVRLTGAQINARLEQLYGFSLSHDQLQERVVERSKVNGWEEWYYVADTDTYYHFSNGTVKKIVEPYHGVRRADGTVYVVCRDSLAPQVIYQVELAEGEEGWRFLSLQRVEEDEDGAGPGPLTQEELAELGAQLSQNGVCQLFWSGFYNMERLDLSQLLYDGAGVAQGALTQGERDALAAQGADLSLDVVKVTAEQIEQVLYDRFRQTLPEAEIRARLSNWYYLADQDAYYHCHGDTRMLPPITCTQGERLESGAIRLTCQVGAVEEDIWQVEVMPTRQSWYILSVVRADGYGGRPTSGPEGQTGENPEPEETKSPIDRPLTQGELDELAAWCQKYDMVFFELFDSVAEVDLAAFLWEGTDRVGPRTDLSWRERELLQAQGANVDWQLQDGGWVVRLTTAEIQDYVARILGVSAPAAELEKAMLGSRYYRWYYVEGEDAYYHFGGGEPGADILECWEGWRREDGTLQVTCWEGAASFYELELRPADTDIGYQLISVDAFGD